MSKRPARGSVVAWWNEGSLEFAVVGGEEKQRVRLVLPGGREERVQPSRIAFAVEPSEASPDLSLDERKAVGRRAGAAEERARRRALAVDVRALWEVATETGHELDLEALTELALGEDSGEARAAVALALQDDALHFARRKETWEARSPETVAELRRERETAAHRAGERQLALAALTAASRGETFVPTGTDAERRCLAALEDLAVRDGAASDGSRALALEVLDAAAIRGDRPAERAFRLLRRVGRFASDDENLLVRRHGLRTKFPENALAAAREAAARGWSRAGRRDLTELEVVTVDGPETREIDDALSLERTEGGGFRLGVHIADPCAFVPIADATDVEAFARASSLYLPDLRLSMLPEAISEQAASLVEGEDRPALSFLAEVGPEGEVLRTEVVRSAIRSRSRLDYHAADGAIERCEGPWAPLLSEMLSLAALLEARRIERGALVLAAKEVEVRVGEGGRILLERIDTRSPSHRLVSEAMILAGALAAQFCIERGIPVLFRRQPPPSALPPMPPGEIHDPVLLRSLRRALRRGEVSLQAGPHFALGLPAYAQVTSPLRRYQDLIAHRQILAVLEGLAPPYGIPELQRIAATTERGEAEARQAERAADLYWRLRYLEQSRATAVEGTVVELNPTIVQLGESLLEERVPGLSGVRLGDRLTLRVERVNPRAELLILRPA